MASLATYLDRKLRSLYPDPSKRRIALNELLRYGASAGEPEPERVRLAILKLAGRDLEAVKKTVEGAREDPEDILDWAERPRETRSHLQNRKLHENERRRIDQEDRDEWNNWLAEGA